MYECLLYRSHIARLAPITALGTKIRKVKVRQREEIEKVIAALFWFRHCISTVTFRCTKRYLHCRLSTGCKRKTIERNRRKEKETKKS